MDERNPMDKNELGAPIPSRNQHTGRIPEIKIVAGERGAADAERDIRGFALKFYTEEGNWDMVGNNTPVFFFRDPMKFIDLNHAIKRDPRTNMRSPNSNWDFWTSLPEALLQVTIIMGDRGLPSSYRRMHGFSSHAYSFINEESELHYEPNSYGNWEDHPEDNLPKEKGGDVYRYDFRKDDSDYYTQPGLLFRAMTDDQKQVLFYNTARNMGDSTLQIKHRHIYNCYQADPEYGIGVAKAMNIEIEDVDLNLPKKDSYKNLKIANNLHPELNIPTDPVDPGKEIHTNTEPYILPEYDPWLL